MISLDPPIIFSKNYVNADDTFNVSSGAAAISKIYDRDNNSPWVSSGANNDATDVSIEIIFYDGKNAVNRTIDTIMLLNHNIKALTVSYWNGSAYVNLTTQSALAAASSSLAVGPVTTSKIKLDMTSTQSANAEKSIGELYVLLTQLNLGADMMGYTVKSREKVVTNIMGDGTMVKIFTPITSTRTDKYEAMATFHYLPTATIVTLQAIRDAKLPFVWQPEPTWRPDQVFYVFWASPWAYRFSDTYKGAGYTIDIDFKEV